MHLNDVLIELIKCFRINEVNLIYKKYSIHDKVRTLRTLVVKSQSPFLNNYLTR